MKADWEAKKKLCENLAGDRKSQEDKRKECELNITRVQNRTATSLEAWELFGDEYPMLISEVETKYSDAIKRRTHEQIVDNQKGRHSI